MTEKATRIMAKAYAEGQWSLIDSDREVELYLRRLNLWEILQKADENDEDKLVMTGYDRELCRFVAARKFVVEGDNGYALAWCTLALASDPLKLRSFLEFIKEGFAIKVDPNHPIIIGNAPPQQKFS